VHISRPAIQSTRDDDRNSQKQLALLDILAKRPIPSACWWSLPPPISMTVPNTAAYGAEEDHASACLLLDSRIIYRRCRCHCGGANADADDDLKTNDAVEPSLITVLPAALGGDGAATMTLSRVRPCQN
jgi:hypothetical protein